ncbi:SIMPL domain-containing protein [Profundibacterium mesophilum]|nr:SIMPL domain-containing protein [Profundibacterium mesophilum]
MRSIGHIALAALGLGLLAGAGPLTGAAFAQETAPGGAIAPARLSVSGEGHATGEPDMARFRTEARARAETAGAAIAQMRGIMEPLIAALREAGIAARDMQTSRLSLQPLHSEQDLRGVPPAIVGYEAVSQLSLTIRDVDRLGEIVDLALETGANGIDDLGFEMADSAALRDTARRRAVEDAIRAATVLAQAAGMRLGPLVALSEGGAGTPPQPMFMEAARMGGMPVARGAVEISAHVEASFALLAP